MDDRLAGLALFKALYCIPKGQYEAAVYNAEAKCVATCTGHSASSVSEFAEFHARMGDRVVMIAGRA